MTRGPVTLPTTRASTPKLARASVRTRATRSVILPRSVPGLGPNEDSGGRQPVRSARRGGRRRDLDERGRVVVDVLDRRRLGLGVPFGLGLGHRRIGELRDLAVQVGELLAPVKGRLGHRRRGQCAQRRPSGRPLSHAPAHVARESRARLGGAGDVPAGGSHQEADGCTGDEHQRGQGTQHDDDADADLPDEIGEHDPRIGAREAPVALGVGGVGGREREDERRDADHRACAQRSELPDVGLEEDRSADHDEQDGRDGGRAADDEAQAVVELEADDASVPAQVLHEPQEHAQGKERPSKQVCALLSGRTARRSVPPGGL